MHLLLTPTSSPRRDVLGYKVYTTMRNFVFGDERNSAAFANRICSRLDGHLVVGADICQKVIIVITRVVVVQVNVGKAKRRDGIPIRVISWRRAKPSFPCSQQGVAVAV